MGNVGEEMVSAHQARREFEADRWGHNNPRGQEPTYGRIKYMTHAGGYVMARRPHCMPFVISEKLWRSFQIFDKAWHRSQ